MEAVLEAKWGRQSGDDRISADERVKNFRILPLLQHSVIGAMKLNHMKAQAVLDSAAATAEAAVIARYGECDLLDEQQGAAYDAVLFPLLAEQTGDMALSDLLDLVG